MKRVHTYLSEYQYESIRRRAFDKHSSMAEVVREAVDKYLAEPKADAEAKKDPLTDLIGAFDNPAAPKDLAANHDRYLYDTDDN